MTRNALAVLPALLVLAACTTNPATGRKQFNAIDQKQEIALGVEAAPQVAQQYGGALKNQTVQQYVSEIGKKLAAKTEADNPKLPWEFTMLDSDVINAFSLPGGKVFFSKGLAVKLQNEAQMAAVLGHECGHVTARHINDQMTHEMEVNLAGGLASVLLEGKGGGAGAQITPQIIQFGGQSILLRFSRGQENEADTLGLRYMTKAGYDPKAMLGVMQILQEAMQGNRAPEFLSTHPYPETRIKNIQTQLQQTYAKTGGATNDQPYRERMLRPLGARAQAPRPSDGALAAGPGDLGAPVLWCEHCRREAQLAAARVR